MLHRVSAFIVALLVLLPTPGRAQTATDPGSIRGSVTAIGGTTVLPGTQITITNSAGFQAGVTITDGDGAFSLTDVPPGAYTLAASLDGFMTMTRAIRVDPAKQTQITVDLPLSGFAERVNVEAA